MAFDKTHMKGITERNVEINQMLCAVEKKKIIATENCVLSFAEDLTLSGKLLV